MNEEIIKRYTPPSKLDHAPLGTISKVVVDDSDTCVYYIQVSADPDNTKWERLGIVLEGLFAEEIINYENFGSDLLNKRHDFVLFLRDLWLNKL